MTFGVATAGLGEPVVGSGVRKHHASKRQVEQGDVGEVVGAGRQRIRAPGEALDRTEPGRVVSPTRSLAVW